MLLVLEILFVGLWALLAVITLVVIVAVALIPRERLESVAHSE